MNFITHLKYYAEKFLLFFINKYHNSFLENYANINWHYLNKFKLPQKFILKYLQKIKQIKLSLYSDNFIKYILDNNVKLKIVIKIKNKYYKLLRNRDEDFLIYLLENYKLNKIDFIDIFSLLIEYPFSYNFYKKYIIITGYFETCITVPKDCDISSFTEDDIDDIIKNVNLSEEINQYNQYNKNAIYCGLLCANIKKRKLNKRQKNILLNNENLHVNIIVFELFMRKYYFSHSEIKILLNRELNEKQIEIVKKYHSHYFYHNL